MGGIENGFIIEDGNHPDQCTWKVFSRCTHRPELTIAVPRGVEFVFVRHVTVRILAVCRKIPSGGWFLGKIWGVFRGIK